MLQVLALWVGLLAPGGDAKLHLTVDPDDAVVEVNGKKLKGFKSGEAVSVPPGNVTVEVGADGHVPQKKALRIDAGKSARLTIKLAKKSGGTLTPVGKGGPGRKPGPVAKPGPAPTPRPGPVAKPDDKPAPRPGPIGKAPDRDPPKAPIGKPGFKPKPKDDDGPRAKPKDDDGPRAKPKADGPRAKPKGDARRPRPKTDDRPRPVRKPRGSGGGYGGSGVRDDRDTGPTSLKPYAALSFVVGGLAVTGGVVAGIYADKSADKFSQETVLSKKRDLKDESENRAMLSNVLYGVGATGMVVGALLWAMSPDEGAYGAQVMPLADGAMVGWGGTF
jgi:hypothetical protein